MSNNNENPQENSGCETIFSGAALDGFKKGSDEGFSGSVKVKVATGMSCRIKESEFEGQIHKDKEFVIDGEARYLCGTEVVPLNNLDGTRFSACYELSMLEITDTN